MALTKFLYSFLNKPIADLAKEKQFKDSVTENILVSPALTGTPTAPTAAAGDNDTQVATTAFVQQASSYSQYKTLTVAAGSITAGIVAGTYAIPFGDAVQPAAGSLYPISTINLVAADFPSVDGKAAKLRIRAQLYTNDVAPTGNYTIGLFPITRPGTSGGAGLNIYTLGTVVPGSNGATFTTPTADGLHSAVSADFALPADGHYALGVVTTATVAASSHIHLVVTLQIHNA